MSFIDWSQIFVFIIILILLSNLMGKYMANIFEGKKSLLTSLLSGLENACYRLCKINPTEQMPWKVYLKALLMFNFAGFLVLFFIQIFQGYLPLNPQNFPNVPWDLAFNTAASFTTNTNWQAYSGETTLSYLTQMVGLTTQNFASAATGIGAMLVLVRGFKSKQMDEVGNFWVDLIRSVIYILMPFAMILAMILVSQGVVQTIKPDIQITTIENELQTIPLGPVASQVAIKQLGSNGGGFFGANSAHPFENPTPLSNYFEHLAIVLLPSGLVFTFGYMLRDVRQSRVLFSIMVCFWVISIIFAGVAIIQPNPSLDLTHNMEGIETRFELSSSFFWAVSTTNTSNGSNNASLSSMAPLTSGIAMFNMMLGELIMGGVGTGMCMMLKFVLLSVFIAGLMVGRTPEYLGKKIEKTEVLWVFISLLIPCILILIGAAISFSLPIATASISQKGPHGFSEILYAFVSAGNNNGSAFSSLKVNTFYYNIVLGVVMIIARLAIIIPSLAIAGSIAQKHYYPTSQGTLETDNFLFGILLSSIIFIFGTLTYLPALILGPILEHLLMIRGITF